MHHSAAHVALVTSTRGWILSIRLPFAAALASVADISTDSQVSTGSDLPLDDAWFAAEPPLDLHAATDAHDAFFRVARHEGHALAGFRRGVQAAMHVLDDEAQRDGPAMPTQTVRTLRRALAALGTPNDLTPLGLALTAGADPADRPLADAVRRWVRGHQVFAVLTQGLVLTVRALQAAASAPSSLPLGGHLQRLADLYIASALAMRFAADFPRAHYEQAIRPAMSEPHAPAGFSGALSSDHAVLVHELMLARPALELAAHRHPGEHRAARQALAAMYEHHKQVCARLAGLAGPSIRSSVMTHDALAAGELLDRFQARRSQLLR